MDLSGLIFVVLAVAWAGYLIPRALRHHDDLDAVRPVEEFSDGIRVLSSRPTPSTAAPVADPVTGPVVTSARARRAARRRLRVLLLLLTATAVVAGLAGFRYLPWWSVAVPGTAVLCWLIACRTSARHERLRREARAVPAAPAASSSAEVESAPAPVVTSDEVVDPAPAPEDDVDDALWDPLPLTLPTYVTKPVARRTVRTIELTQTESTRVSTQPDAKQEQAAAAAPAAEAGDGDGSAAARAV